MIPYHNYGQDMRDNEEGFSFRWPLLEPNPRHSIQPLWRYSSLSESPEKAYLCPRIKKDGQYYRFSERSPHYREEWSLQSAQESWNYLVFTLYSRFRGNDTACQSPISNNEPSETILMVPFSFILKR